MKTELNQILRRLRASVLRGLHDRRSRRESVALLGLAQHELNDLAVGRSELPGLLADDPAVRDARRC